jgi:diadenosine tetraphosphate (Ap4A) HIT family hydrolase
MSSFLAVWRGGARLSRYVRRVDSGYVGQLYPSTVTTAGADGCLLCSPHEAAAVFHRRTVWESELWRLSLIEEGSPVLGFGHLEPKRHIPYLTDLDGDEAVTVGPVLARISTVLKEATGAEFVYVYVFGERVAHLHFNLAPHSPGDALVGGPGLLHPDAHPVESELLVRTSRAVEVALAG